MQTVYNYELVASMSVIVRCCCFFRPIQRCLTLTQWPGKLYPQNNDICLQLVRDREDDTLLHKDKDSGTRERERERERVALNKWRSRHKGVYSWM